MKNLILLIVFISTQLLQAQTIDIEDITISAIPGTNDINVKTNTFYVISEHNYMQAPYIITNNTITLNICYSTTITTMGSYEEVNTVLPNINNTGNNYTLIVNLYKGSYTTVPDLVITCDYNELQDTATLNFGTPLNNSVSLDTPLFSENNFSIYPNPNTGNFQLKNSTPCSVTIYDVSGKAIFKEEKNISNATVTTNLREGLYFVAITTKEKATTVRKMIIK